MAGGRVAAAAIAFFAAIALVPAAASAKYASYVVDAKTGRVHHSVNADTRNFPASLTKMMTLYLLFEAIEEKRIGLKSRIKVSARAARQPSSRLGLSAGDTITVDIAIRALIVKSANDVASAVAEFLGRTERRFALKMTAKAREIGMTRTTFRNASGLPHRGQLSTARDMATLSKAIFERFPDFYPRFSERAFTYRGVSYRTHNAMLKTYPGSDGMKTGYIHASGYNLVTSAKRGKTRLIGVIFGGKTAKRRDRRMKSMLDRAFANSAAAPRSSARPVYTGAAAPRKAASKTKSRPRFAAKPAASLGKSNRKSGHKRAGVWGIQVGAYYTHRPALKAAKKAVRRLPGLLAGGKVVVTPVKASRGRLLYRARILGVDRRAAYRACRLLKRSKTPCMELKLPGGLELAANAS